VQTRFFNASDLHSETSTSVSADGGSRSLRMTLRMPVGALTELVSRLSSATSHDVQISTHPFSPQAVVQPASLPNANAPPSARQDSTSHAASDASEAVRPSHFEHNFGILRPSVSMRRHLHQPVPPPPSPFLSLFLFMCVYILYPYIYYTPPTHTSQCSSGHSMRSILPPQCKTYRYLRLFSSCDCSRCLPLRS
jgi:hypothetical protein